MTTEREFAEWAEKIRRVRGQAPRRSGVGRAHHRSPLFSLLLFFCTLAIALILGNHYQGQRINPVLDGGNAPQESR